MILSTGPMFLSAEHLRFPYHARLNSLRVLSEPMHRLNGRVITPLFQHMGASSWHSSDAKTFNQLKETLSRHVLLILVSLTVAAVVAIVFWRRRRRSLQGLPLPNGRASRRHATTASPASISDEWSETSDGPSSYWSSEEETPRHHHSRSRSRQVPRWLRVKRGASGRYFVPSRSLLELGWRYVRPISPGGLRDYVDEQLPQYREVPADEERGFIARHRNGPGLEKPSDLELEDFDDDDGTSTVTAGELGGRRPRDGL